jgi:hypothetical protein
MSRFRAEVEVLKGTLSSIQESLKLPFLTPENGRIHHSPISLPQTSNTQLHVPNSAQINTQKDRPVTGEGSSWYEGTVPMDPPVMRTGYLSPTLCIQLLTSMFVNE